LSWMEGDAIEELIDSLGQDRFRMESVGSLLRNLHDSTKPIVHTLEKFSDCFSDPSQDPEVLCHGDPGLGNVIFENGIAKALIDWEFSAPGRRAWDLAFALRYWAPLRDPENTPNQSIVAKVWSRKNWTRQSLARAGISITR
jgi:aminoglycoside phosphotransferase (APT) family kinase protein